MKLKKRKGMTLMECMIAVAISALIASLMVEIMTAVNATMTRTVRLNKRFAHESKYADNLVTQDDSGPFANAPGNVRISYGINSVMASGTSYTTHYHDPRTPVGTFDDGANYRFMSFEKAPASTPHAANVFWIKIVLSADIDQITQIDIAGNCYSHTLDPTTTDYKSQTTITNDQITAADVDFSLRKTAGTTLIEIPVDSDVPNGTIKLTLHKDMVATDGTTFPNYPFEDVTLDYCTQVMKASGTMQYYTESVYTFDGVDFAIQS